MKKQLLFIGNRFVTNTPLQHYIMRSILQTFGHPEAVFYFQESDNSLFLHLEKAFQEHCTLVIVTTRNSFPVIGKLLCTVTSDNQILNDGILMPSKTQVYEADSYLIRHDASSVNVLIATEGKPLPKILIEEEERSAVIHIFEEDEASALAMLQPLSQANDVRLHGTMIVEGWLQLHIQGRKYGNIANFIHASKQLLSGKVIAASNMARYIIEQLQHHQKKITFAESCTGGLIASFFTKESGASNIFEGSLVTYSNALKANWLAVSDLKLEQFGAVSAEVVDEMTEGAMNVSNADYAVAVSGIAGPDGGTELKPVGTIHIGVRSATQHYAEKLHFEGDRNYIQEQSTLYAVKMLLLLDKTVFFED